MGESLLAAYLQPLLDKLAPGPLMNFALKEGFHSDLRKWRSMLRKIKPVLGDAEEKQMNDIEVKRWLDELLVLAYNVDDMLDELRLEALQRQNNSSSDSAASSSQLQDLLAQIREITTRLLEIEEDKNDLGLKERPGVRSSIIDNRLRTTSLVDSSQVVGREKDIDAVLKLLDIGETSKAEENRNRVVGMGGSRSSSINKHGKLEPSLGLKEPCSETLVIPIVGMGGVGKTTLAQCIYNHNTVEKSFDFKSWVCVSDKFDIIGVTKAILCQVASRDAVDVDDLNLLQVRLKENISRQRFLIVLDDIWNEDNGDWEHFFIPLKFGRRGSVVIVTTRSSEVASITGSTSPHFLNPLKDDECLSILAQHALRAENFDAHPHIKIIGEKMVRRCDGLPLAAKTFGELLRNQDQSKWEEVFNSSLWSVSISEKIAPALWLSFNYLSSHLKQCFAYCSIFSEDYEFDEEELILLWMAEGFLGEPNEENQMAVLGHKHFHVLLSRSLLQRSSHKTTKFVMHNFIHYLAQTVAGRVCFRMEDKEAKDVDTEAVHHLSYPLNRLEPKFEVLKNTKRLRTLLTLGTREMYYSDVKNKLLLDDLLPQLPQLRYLRVLSLSYYHIDELPSSIGNLKHLRYLNLSYTNIKLLPQSLCGLHSLQFLILKWCYFLQQLPLRLKDLANLRFLDISGANELREFPPHVLDLKFFQNLTKFVVGVRWGLRKEYHLPGGLTISILDKVEDVEDALVINLMNKKNIGELKFDWWRNLDNTEDAESEVQILNLLEPRKLLRNLEIKGYSGVTFPNWIGDSSYSKLVELSLIDCKRCKSLPSLGQLPLLQKLTIKGMSEIEKIGAELYREASPHGQPFPSLAELHIESCKNLRTLPDGIMGSNSNLQVLEIRVCESLESFPSGVLPSTLTELHIERCKNLRTLPDGIMSSNSNLQVLEIWACESLESFPSGVLPPNLKKLSIRNCRKLESISEMLLGPTTSLDYVCFIGYPNLKSLPECLCTNLTYLCIGGCEGIESVPETPNLAHLEIRSCENLKYLPSNLPKLTSLGHLRVSGCDNLVSLPEGGLPPSLQELQFGRCAKVEKQMWDEWAPHKLPYLTSLSIYGGFRDAVWFPFPTQESQSLLPPTLTSLSIIDFPNLESLSSSAFRKLTSFARLDIRDCPKLQSLPIEALSLSLESLHIERCLELMSKCAEGGEYWARLSLIPDLRIEGRRIKKY